MSLLLWQLVIVFILILINGFFAMSELALVSVRRGRLEKLAEEGNRGARIALGLAADHNTFLGTVQVAITLIGILAAAFGGDRIAGDAGALVLAAIPGLTPWSGVVHYACLLVFVVFLTITSILFGELIPKRIGLVYAEAIAAAVAPPMLAIATLIRPTVRAFSYSVELFFNIFRLRKQSIPADAEEELKDALEEGVQDGVIAKDEQAMIENVLDLGDRTVSSIMTPRPDICWVDLRAELQANMQEIAKSDHSHFPVCDGSLDAVVGMISIKRIWTRLVSNQPVDLKACLTPPLYIPESARVRTLIEQFKLHHRHTFLVTDEFGSISGMVNQVDVLESLVGFIPSLDEKAEERVVQREDGSWLIDGVFGSDDFKKRFGLSHLDGEELGDFKTLGGFVLMHLGRIPRVGESVKRQGFRFEVVDMDGRRIDKVLVVPLPKAPSNPTPPESTPKPL